MTDTERLAYTNRLVELSKMLFEIEANKTHGAKPLREILLADMEMDPFKPEDAARAMMRVVGWEIYSTGEDDLMISIYEAINDDFGHQSTFGISPAWHGIGNWYD